MHLYLRTFVVASVAFVVALCSAPARAQSSASDPGNIREHKTDAGYDVWFPVDNLGAEALGASGLLVKNRPGAARMGLLRPRVQFVSEMLKSVENL